MVVSQWETLLHIWTLSSKALAKMLQDAGSVLNCFQFNNEPRCVTCRRAGFLYDDGPKAHSDAEESELWYVCRSPVTFDAEPEKKQDGGHPKH